MKKKKPTQTQLNLIPNLVPRYPTLYHGTIQHQHPPSVSADAFLSLKKNKYANLILCKSTSHWKIRMKFILLKTHNKRRLETTSASNWLWMWTTRTQVVLLFQNQILLSLPSFIDPAIWKFISTTSTQYVYDIPSGRVYIHVYRILYHKTMTDAHMNLRSRVHRYEKYK